MQIFKTNDELKEEILQQVGAGALTLDEATRTLNNYGITIPDGYRRSLLAFEASAILEANGFTRNGMKKQPA